MVCGNFESDLRPQEVSPSDVHEVLKREFPQGGGRHRSSPRSRQRTPREPEGGWLEPGAWRLETGAWRLAAGVWSLEAGAWSLQAGGLEPGAWSLAAGGWRLACFGVFFGLICGIVGCPRAMSKKRRAESDKLWVV